MQDQTPENSELDWSQALRRAWPLLLVAPVLGASIGFGLSYVVTPTFTARTTIMPPQQQQSAAAAALSSLGGLASLAGAGAALRTPADQYATLMQSQTIEDRLVDQFQLKNVYREEFKVDARTKLEKRTRVAVGKRDGLITVEVDDEDPTRAATLANQYIVELRKLTAGLAVSEAQQRRVFFEGLLSESRNKLAAAQIALERTGVSAGAMRSEPKNAAETYGRLKAQVTAADVRLQTMRVKLADSTPEMQAQIMELSALRSELARLEQTQNAPAGSDYIGRLRDFKYHEALFELFAKQYELARVDESREGTLIQVIDAATPPEKRSWPKRSLLTAAGALAAFFLMAVAVVARATRRRAAGAASGP
jgi:uncharacterized protein involved in exopolysaccharide biosynthesis